MKLKAKPLYSLVEADSTDSSPETTNFTPVR